MRMRYLKQVADVGFLAILLFLSTSALAQYIAVEVAPEPQYICYNDPYYYCVTYYPQTYYYGGGPVYPFFYYRRFGWHHEHEYRGGEYRGGEFHGGGGFHHHR